MAKFCERGANRVVGHRRLSEELDEDELLRKRQEATDLKHEPFRKMIATKLLGWSFPEAEEDDQSAAKTGKK